MRSKSSRFLLCLILVCIFIPYSALASLRVTFFDTGAGNTALLQADGQTMLIDAGTKADEDVLLTYLTDFGIPKFDLLASTLFREGTANGISAVLDKYQAGTIWLPGMQAGEQTTDQTLAVIQSSGAKVITPVPGDQMNVGNAKVTVVGLKDQSGEAAPYLALRVEYGEHAILFLPNVDVEGALPESGADLQADVLSISGEGIPSQVIIDAVSPLWAVAGGEPQAVELARTQGSGIRVLQPLKNGAVTFISDGSVIQAEYEAAGVTNQSSINLRKDASTKASKIATLSKGTVVGILGSVEGKEGLWYHVEADGKVGFVRGDLIQEVSKEEAERLWAEATPKPRRSNNSAQNDGNGEDTQEEAPLDCH